MGAGARRRSDPKIGEELTGAAVRAILCSPSVLILALHGLPLPPFPSTASRRSSPWLPRRADHLGACSRCSTDRDHPGGHRLYSWPWWGIRSTTPSSSSTASAKNLQGRACADRPFGGLVDLSINECLSRTLVTSLTTLVSVLVLMIWGGEVIRDFTVDPTDRHH